MYYIAKEGAQLRAIYGPYDTFEAAQNAFKEAYNAFLAAEPPKSAYHDWDGYHSYQVVELPVKIGDEETRFVNGLPYTPIHSHGRKCPGSIPHPKTSEDSTHG